MLQQPGEIDDDLMAAINQSNRESEAKAARVESDEEEMTKVLRGSCLPRSTQCRQSQPT